MSHFLEGLLLGIFFGFAGGYVVFSRMIRKLARLILEGDKNAYR